MKIGLVHELSHEATGKSGPMFETEQFERDAVYAAELLMKNAGVQAGVLGVLGTSLKNNVLKEKIAGIISQRAENNVKVISSTGKNMLSKVHTGQQPNVIFVEASEGQSIYDGSKYVTICKKTNRTVSRKYGINTQLIFCTAQDMEEELKKVTSDKLFQDNAAARVMVFANKDKSIKKDENHERIMKLFKDTVDENKLTGMVAGIFMPENEIERFSMVTLGILGIGLMDYSRIPVKERDLDRGSELGESIKDMFMQLIDNPEKFQNISAKDLISGLFSGEYFMEIKKINYEEIRDYMESEAAVLESL